MKKLLFILLSLSLLVGCSKKVTETPSNDNNTDTLKIVATMFPQYDFARAVAGDTAEIKMLVPPASESHSFEPTPQDIITIQNCDVFLYNGGDSDDWVDRILASIDTEDIKIYKFIDFVTTVEEEVIEGMEVLESDHDDHDDYDEIELDEHVWTSPKNAKTIVSILSEIFSELYPENNDIYLENAEKYIDELDKLDQDLEKLVADAERRIVLFGDRFPFRYLAKDYGLEYFAAFPSCSNETDASASTVAFLIDKVKAEDIPVVFYTEFSNQKMADIICEETNAKKLLLHSCHNVSRDDLKNGVTYLELMKQNIVNLKEALN